MRSTNKKLYLEDIAVGMEFVSGEHQLDAAQIKAFASQFDPQPFHLDEQAAQGSFFQGLAASGWHTMAITMRLLVESAELSWPRPTRPNDVLHVKSTITDIKPSRSKPDRAIVLVHALTLNQDDEVRQDFTAKLLAFKREV
jgi:acyl dehydratase